MKEKDVLDLYIVTRYFLDKDPQMKISDYLSPKSNSKIFNDMLYGLQDKKYEMAYISGSEFRVYFSKELSNTRLLLKFAKRKDKVLYNATDEDINSLNVDDYPFSYIIVDVAQQLFLIQKNNDISTSLETLINSVQKVFASFVIDKGLHIHFTPITKKGAFWETVNKYIGKIQTVEFELFSPNFLGQSYSTNELMRELKQETNTSSLKLSLKNEKGFLQINEKYPFFKDTLEYIANGGGKWILKILGSDSVSSNGSIIEQGIITAKIEEAHNDKILEDTFKEIADIESNNHNHEDGNEK